MRLLLVALLGSLLPACVESQATRCGNQVCPEGRACAPSGEPRCVDDDLVDACLGREEEEACEVAGGRPGVCTGGLCLLGGCGDGRINGMDECDGADLGGKTCKDFGSSEPQGLVCEQCRFNPAGCPSRCGDGIINGIEECDGADFGGQTCKSFGFYEDETLTCNAAGTDRECTVNVSACTGGICGDGVLQGFEQCDGAALAQTCAAMGFFGAVSSPQCTEQCGLTTSSCLCGGFLCARFSEQCVDVGSGNLSCQPCPQAGC